MKKGRSGNLVKSRECKACSYLKAKEDWANGKNRRSRSSMLAMTYNLSEQVYESMLEAQGGVCAICGSAPPEGKHLSVDHDHSCCAGRKSCGLCVRGLLCIRCNMVLGHVDEDVEVLRGLIEYIEGRYATLGLQKMVQFIEAGALPRFNVDRKVMG